MQRTVYGTENCQPILAGMARIALNARLLVANKLEGIGWFTHECFSRIAANHPEHQFLLLFDRRPDSMFDYGDHVEVKHLWPPARRPMLYDWWFDYSVTRAIRRWNADVFVSTDGFLSRRTSIPQLAVMHDLNFMHHPQWMPPREARYYRSRFPQFASIASRLATVSDYSQNDLVEQFGLDPDRIDVIPNAPASAYAVLDEESKASQRKRWSEGNPYFIFVGSLHPRKNIEGLLAAFAAYKAGGGLAHLVVVGSSMWTEEMRATMDVHWVGRLDRVDLALAMGGALGLQQEHPLEGAEYRMCVARISTIFLMLKITISGKSQSAPNRCISDTFTHLSNTATCSKRYSSRGSPSTAYRSGEITCFLTWPSL